MQRLGAIAICLVALSTAAQAGDVRPRGDDRYTVSEVKDGILRVDRMTGAVSLCHDGRRGWSCELVPDDRAAMEREIEALHRENRQLRRQLADADPRLAQDPRYSRIQPQDDLDGSGGVMTRQEVDDAMNTLEYMMGRFMGTAKRLRQQAGEPPLPPR